MELRKKWVINGRFCASKVVRCLQSVPNRRAGHLCASWKTTQAKAWAVKKFQGSCRPRPTYGSLATNPIEGTCIWRPMSSSPSFPASRSRRAGYHAEALTLHSILCTWTSLNGK